MRHFTEIKKRGFVMLLANLKVCWIGECEGVDEGVKSAVGVNFGREATSIHDIEFRGVVADKTGEEVNEEAGAWEVKDFFACFVRTCSWSLMLLANLAEHRLQANASATKRAASSAAIQASSAFCRCCNWRASAFWRSFSC